MSWLLYLKWYDALRVADSGQFAYPPFAGPFCDWPYWPTRYLEALRDTYIDYLKERQQAITQS